MLATRGAGVQHSDKNPSRRRRFATLREIARGTRVAMTACMSKQSFRVGTDDVTIEKLDLPSNASQAEIEAAMRHVIDNCPDCQAARARGETPTIVSGRDLLRGIDQFRRPRWRDLKRRVRR
jgi:hypothetical protein